MFFFKAYGLMVQSNLLLPGLYQGNVKPSSIDVEILTGHVSPTGLINPVEQGLFFQATPNALWLNVPQIARFLVQSGERIVVEPASGVMKDSLSAFLRGPCFAALLMQRDLFVLTGNVLKVQDRAIAYVGESCTGKSSLLTSMMQRGYLPLSDGLCVINQEGYVFPGFPDIELWDDSAKTLNISTKSLCCIRQGIKKYRLPLHHKFHNSPLPLEEIYILNPGKEDRLRHKALAGSGKINFLQKNIYNKAYLTGLQKDALYFNYCAKLSGQIHMTLVEFDGIKFNIDGISNYMKTLQDKQYVGG